MKVRYLYVITLLFFLSCQSDTEQKEGKREPKEITTQWLNSWDKDDFTSLKSISTGNTLKYVSEMESFYKGVKETNPKPSITIKKMNCDKVDDQLVQCKYCCNKGEKEIFTLIKERGQWKVADIMVDLELFDQKDKKKEEDLDKFLNKKLSN